MSARDETAAGRDDGMREEAMTEDRFNLMDPEGLRQFKALLQKRWLEYRRRLYLRTRNPIHALEVYRVTRSTKIDTPDWVLELFDQWAQVLCVDAPQKAEEITYALGLGTKGGGRSKKLQAATDLRHVRIAERVLQLLQEDPERKKLDIFLEVGEEFNVSDQTVARIWYKLTREAKR